jgi:hypothetical protein
MSVVLPIIQVVTVILVAVTMSMSLAHALELPGKKRLDKETYLAVQAIYYPGFTIGGSVEPLSIVATLLSLFMTRAGDPAFWLTRIALACIIHEGLSGSRRAVKLGRNVAIVSGGAEQRIKLHIDAGGLQDLPIQVKKEPRPCRPSVEGIWGLGSKDPKSCYPVAAPSARAT